MTEFSHRTDKVGPKIIQTMTARTKRACDRCYKLKQTCIGTPCNLCTKSSSECTFNRPMPKMGRPRASKDKESTPRVKYSHNACYNCKKRKQKCDEHWPTCLLCKKLKIDCSGPLKMLKITESNPKPSIEKPQIEFVTPMVPVPDIQSEMSNPVLPGLDAMSPLIQSLMSPQIGSLDIMDLTGDLFDNSDGILNNKERLFLNSLIKSPTFPVEFKNNESHKNDQESPASIVSSEYTDMYEEQKSYLISTYLVPTNHVPRKELELLKYFITDVSSLLFVDKTSTTFLRTVVPLCIEDPNVRYPIIGISASHRANSQIGENIECKRDAAIYRAKSQSMFISHTVDYFKDLENLLLSILLLAIQEIFEGTSVFWSFALEKAALIIGKRGGLRNVATFAPLSVQLFCYLDLISSLSTCSTPFVDNTELGEYDEDHIERILNNKFGFKFGIAGELFKIIGNISTLASLRSLRYESPESEKKFNTLATLIELRLQNWSPSLDGHQYLIDNSVNDGKKMLSNFTVTLQWSAFLRLHQIRNGYNRQDPRVEACLDLILRATKEIDADCDLETGLLFPLIMAGSVAYKQSDRDYILSRIRSIKDRLKFSYIGEFEQLILLVWNRDLEEGKEVNWAKMRFYQYPGLVMF